MQTDFPRRDVADSLLASVTRDGSARTSPALYRTLLRMLADGDPVPIAHLAAATGRAVAEVENTVAGWPDTEYDEQGRIIGWGLTLRPTPHRFVVDGKQLYTWCALDTLFFPAVIGRCARIEASCHATEAPIRLNVDPSVGVIDLDPAAAVVSLVIPGKMNSVRAAFCDPGRFFATADAACDWRASHPGMLVLPVVDAYQAARPLSDSLLVGTGEHQLCCPR